MAGEIVVSDALEKLKEEIRLLKITLAGCLEKRDDLKYHICPELRARYAKEIGDYQARANAQEIMILELKRKIEITRAALNREKSISEEEVEEQVKEEYQEFHQKVDEEYKKYEEYQEEQAKKEEKRQYYEKRWKEEYGSNESNESDTRDDDYYRDDSNYSSGTTKEKKAPNAKELYRKIVKKLHPDMNPNVSEREKELFHKAAKAYEEGDIFTLQQIYDEVFGVDTEEVLHEDTIEELIALKERILEEIEKVNQEIDNIKMEFPYTEKEFLDNSEAVKKKQDAIKKLIEEYEEEIERLNKLLEEVNKEMEEVINRKNV